MNKLLAQRSMLVIEDEMLIVMMIEDMLTDLGCEDIATAATVDQAIWHLSNRTFDIAMLDMNLGGESSEVVADALVKKNVPFVYSTGNTARDMQEGHQDRPVLRKPFRFEALEELLAAVLSERRALPRPLA